MARECALQLLYQLDLQAGWDPAALETERYWQQVAELEQIGDRADPRRVRKFAARLVDGVVANREKIDGLLNEAADNWRLDRMNVVDRNILRLAAYEITAGEGIPPLAALDEAIELAKEFGDKDSARFINGILDRLMKNLASASIAQSQ
jgi:N utilization substance protein B